MKPISLILPKIKIRPKIRLRTLISLAIAILVLVGLVGFGYLQKTGKIGEINLGLLLGKLAIELPEKEEAPAVPAIPSPEEEPAEKEAPAFKVYEKEAESGEGITHLARKALKEYLEEKGADLNLTPEHKVYIEDYIQKKIGDRWLELGEKVTFSEELVAEGIDQAQKLTPEELENLKQYSALVPSF